MDIQDKLFLMCIPLTQRNQCVNIFIFFMEGVYMKKILKLFLILCISILVGTLLLLIVNTLPNDKMKKHILESVPIMESEGDYPEQIPGYISSRLDNYTDAIMLVSTAHKAETSLVDRTINMYRVSYKDKRPPEVLAAFGKGDEGYTISSYSRYWHGYQVILKLLLLILNYQEIRYINMCLQNIIISFAVITLWKKDLKLYIAPYLIMIYSLMPVSTALSLQFSTIFYLMNVASIILLNKFEKFEAEGNTLIFFLCVGIVTSFFDFLTYPLITLGVPLTFYFVLSSQNTFLSSILKLRI